MSTNDITGDRLVSKVPTKSYLDNYDKIFNKGESTDSSSSSCGCGADSKCDTSLVEEINEEVR